MINITQEEIMKNWGGGNISVPLVSVRCITYNHEPYIAQTLDGFMMQKTNFPFEVIVHDDASTDKTADIIREYEAKFPKIIKPIYETENQFSKHDGSLDRIMDAACKGKYTAICEGDDYWIDEHKLQKQVDFLEHNPDYGLVYANAKQLNQKKNEISLVEGHQTDFYHLVTETNYIPALTTCFRTDLYKKYTLEIQPESRGWLMGDYPIWIYLSFFSKIKYFEEYMAVYRILENSASHFTDIDKFIQFRKSVYDIKQFYNLYFKVNADIKWDESIYYVSMHFSAGHRKQLKDYSKSVSRKNDRIKVKLAKYPVLFYIVVFISKIKNCILSLFRKQ